MKIKTTFAALALILSPGLALAQGCNEGRLHDTTASMSCAEGTTLDAETGTCVPVVSG